MAVDLADVDGDLTTAGKRSDSTLEVTRNSRVACKVIQRAEGKDAERNTQLRRDVRHGVDGSIATRSNEHGASRLHGMSRRCRQRCAGDRCDLRIEIPGRNELTKLIARCVGDAPCETVEQDNGAPH